MAKTIDYYLSLNSPWAYLGGPRIEEMAARHGATIRVHPVDLGSIFPRSGGLPLPKRAPQRQAYRMAELKRWRAHLGMPLNLEPKHFPAPDLEAACLVIAAGEAGGDPVRLAQAILRAVWAEERNIADHATLEALLEETGHDKALLETAREARGDDGGRLRARRVRLADLHHRRRAVLGPGPARLRRAQAGPLVCRVICFRRYPMATKVGPFLP